jgi:hypothetical protein
MDAKIRKKSLATKLFPFFFGAKKKKGLPFGKTERRKGETKNP